MFANDIPLAGGASGLRVPPQSIGDESDYTAFTAAGNGGWVLGSTLKGVKLLVTVLTGALGAGTAGVRVLLRGGTDANGGSAATVANSATTWEPSDAADITNKVLRATIDCAGLDPAKYYSLALSVKGNGSGTLIAGASAVILDPPQKS